jgi:hypothetical protein
MLTWPISREPTNVHVGKFNLAWLWYLRRDGCHKKALFTDRSIVAAAMGNSLSSLKNLVISMPHGGENLRDHGGGGARGGVRPGEDQSA